MLDKKMNNPLRIIHLISGDLWAGAEVQAFTLLKQLDRQAKLKVIVYNQGTLSRRLQDAGIDMLVLEESKYSFFQLLAQTRAQIKQFGADIVHTHRQKENIIGALAILNCKNTKSIRTTHGASEFEPNLKQRVQIALDNFCGRFIQSRIISVSEELKVKLKKTFPESKIHVIENGIDREEVIAESLSKPFSPKAFDHTMCNIGFVGRLEQVKRPDLFIKMAAHIIASGKVENPHFHLFGDGSLLEPSKRLAEELLISSHISFHGHCESVRYYMGKLDLIVMPSDHEGLPMTLLEGLALGVPFVVHNTGAMGEIIGKQNSNLLVDVQSAEPYALACASALMNRTKVHLDKCYFATTNAERVMAIYHEVLG